MSWEPRLHVEARCRHCGRIVPARLKAVNSTEAEGQCPRCGHKPFYVDRVIGYVNNIGAMDLDEALEFAGQVESEEQLEVLVRVELLSKGRDEVLQALLDRFDQLDAGSVHHGFEKAVERLPLPELKEAIRQEIDEDEAFKKSYALMVAAEVERGS